MVTISDAARALATIDEELQKLERDLADAERMVRFTQDRAAYIRTQIATLRSVGMALLGEQS